MDKESYGEIGRQQNNQSQGWQEVDARVLGQILAAQNIVFALPDITRIAEFYAQTLISIPGINACRVCLGGRSVQAGAMKSGACDECKTLHDISGKDDVFFPADPNFKCALADQPDTRIIPIHSYQHHFGFFVSEIENAAIFNAYHPFIRNLSNHVALILENRLQRDWLQKAHDELERRVEERTRDLVSANTSLQEEIEIRRRAEEALRASEKQIKQLIDISPIAMIVASGIEERVESVNDKFIELFGYTIKDIPDAAHWWPLAYPDENYREEIKTQWQTRVEQAIGDKNEIEPMEATVVCKDGSRRYVEFRLSSVGQRHLITFVDLTEHKQAEEELLEREGHSQSLLQLSRNLERSQTYSEVLNAARDEVRTVIGYQSLWVYLVSEDKKHARALVAGGELEEIVMSEDGTATLSIEGDRMLEEIVNATEIVVVEDARTDERTNKEIVTRIGNRTIVNVPIILFDRHLGSIGTGTIGDEGVRPPTKSEREYLTALASHMAVALDRIHLLTERRQAEQALHESEERFRSFVEKANDIVYTVSPDGVFTYVSPNWKEMLGHEAGEVEGRSFEFFVHPDDLAACRAILHRAFVSGEKQSGFEYRVKHKDGSWQWHTSNASVIRNADGGIVAFLGIARNITERKHSEEEIHKLNQELEQRVVERTAQLEAANHELEAFAYSVSHDLRAPLRHIDGFIGMLQQKIKTNLDDQSQHYMDVIAASANKMGMLIDDLLSFSRMGRNEMFKSQVDLNELVQDVIQEFKSEAEGRDIQWKISPLPLVTGDRAMLHVVLVNLIANALKFTYPRKIAQIEVGCEVETEREVVIFVRDNGVGFDMNYADKLFGVFQRLHRQEDFEGTGIGLANVRRVISRHGGRTWAEGKADQGATFYFSLPQPRQEA